MNKVALVSENGEVNGIVSTHVDSIYADGQLYDGLLAKHLSIDSDNDEYISRKYWDFGSERWADRDPRPSGYMVWNNNAWVLDSNALFDEVRQYRDSYLFACDWTQMPDSPLSDSKKAEWASYRTALRDVPANNSSVTRLEDVAWPTKPE